MSGKERGSRHNEGKVPLELVPKTAQYAVARALQYGLKKYAKDNWRKGMTISTQLGCLERHLAKFSDPHISDFDEESGLHHMIHLVCNAALIIETLVQHQDLDDRFEYEESKKMTKEEWLKHLGMK